jgi:hypothetical protein
MRWVTRRHIRVNRTATAWLVRRFVDPSAESLFVEPEEVARVERETVERAAFLHDALYVSLREESAP